MILSYPILLLGFEDSAELWVLVIRTLQDNWGKMLEPESSPL